MLVQRDNFSGTSGIWTFIETSGTVSVTGGELRMRQTGGGNSTCGARLTTGFTAANGDNIEGYFYMQNPEGEDDFFLGFARGANLSTTGVFWVANNTKTKTRDYPAENAVDLDTNPLPTSAPGRHHRIHLEFTPSEEIKWYRTVPPTAEALERTLSGISDIAAGQTIYAKMSSEYYDPNEIRCEAFARWTENDRNPPPPDNLTATAQGTESILLEFDDVATAINGDTIRIEMDDGGGFTEIDAVALGIGEYLVEGLDPDTEYDFRARVRTDVHGTNYHSDYTATATATTDAEPEAGGGGGLNRPMNMATLISMLGA